MRRLTMKLFPLNILISVFVLSAFSCKDEESAKTNIEPVLSPQTEPSPKNTMSPEEKRLKEANKRLGWIMQDMEVPEYKLDRMYKRNEFTSEEFIKYANDVINNARKFNEIDHPDKKLVTLAKDMLKAVDGFESALTSKDEAKLKSSWETLTKACAACHKDYKKGGGGY